MDKIYKTKYGTYIDLSEIFTIDKSELFSINAPNSEIIRALIISKSNSKPIERSIDSLDCTSADEYVLRSKEAFDDLVRAWVDFSKSQDVIIVNPEDWDMTQKPIEITKNKSPLNIVEEQYLNLCSGCPNKHNKHTKRLSCIRHVYNHKKVKLKAFIWCKYSDNEL